MTVRELLAATLDVEIRDVELDPKLEALPAGELYAITFSTGLVALLPAPAGLFDEDDPDLAGPIVDDLVEILDVATKRATAPYN